MHLLNTYALATASKVDKCSIFETYFPVGTERYITIQEKTKFDSKDYSYWDDLIKIIYPLLEKNNIKIVQIGGPTEHPYPYTINLLGKTDFNQLSYVIRNSMLHVGSDSLGVHMASMHDIPIVALYSVSQSAVSGPYFGDKNKQILFDAYLRTPNQKPSYAAQEHPKCINLIKPEEIADAIFKLLKIDFEVPFETVYTGEKYCNKIVREFIPTQAIQVASPETPMEIRMDIEFNEQVLGQQLSISKGIIVTDKRINLNLLRQLKPNIAALVYVVGENDDPKFIEDIKPIGLTIILISYLDSDKIEPKKINYYQYGKINKIESEKPEVIEKLRKNMDKLYFRSNKIVLSKDKVYMGNSSRKADKPIINDFEYQKVIDCEEFWRDLAFCTIIKKI